MTRRVFFRIFCTLFGVLCLLLTIGSMSSGLSTGGPGGDLHVLLLGHAAVLGCLAAGFLVQLHRPETRVAAWQLVLVTVLVLVAVAVVEQIADPVFEIGFPLALLLTGALHPARGQLLRPSATLSPVLAPVALLALVPAAVAAVQLLHSTDGLGGDRLLAVQAGAHVLMTVPFLGLLAALQTRGWRFPLVAAGAIPVVLGLGSVAHPGELGSLGTGGGVVAALLGLGFVAAGVWEASRAARTAGQPVASTRPT